MSKNTVVINGKLYDAITGMPITDQPAAPKTTVSQKKSVPVSTPKPVKHMSDVVAKKPTSADRIRTKRPEPIHVTQIAKKQSRSQTLNRQFVKKPTTKVINYRDNTKVAPVATSPMISKFAKDKQPIVKRATEPTMKQTPKIVDKPAIKHDMVARVEQKRNATVAPVQTKPTNSRELKDALIREQMEKPIAKTTKAPKRKRKLSIFTIATASLALVILGGYFTYVNMPSISVRVAASRAGVNAKYPEYNPSGYRIDGPVAFAPGTVTINYKSNSNDQHYSISQQNSSWDSDAVFENKVQPESGNYQTLSQKGLTIYKYDNKASWVNGGVLYTIDGDAALSTDQVLRIVDSM